ncbi:MAG: hypothetical protein IH838_11330 [Proteobacteria bacterium]|nr:hypothetical protein [Pseudomonadota bacterium]
MLLFASPAWAAGGYIVGAGVEADSDDANALTISAEFGLAENTWITTALAKNQVDLPRGISIDTLYADIGIDHWFDPLGVRVGVAYWGDNEILDSVDLRGSLYWRNDKVSVSGNFEYRDFSFDIFRDDLQPGQDVRFHAKGAGLSVRFELNDAVDLRLSGIDYTYNVDLSRAANAPIRDFLSVSRLSLINSLIDYRVRIGLGIDVGEQRWSLDYATWKGEVDGSKTDSTTLRFLTPMGKKSDIEFGLGVDDSDTYGSVTLFSLFVYFYG